MSVITVKLNTFRIGFQFLERIAFHVFIKIGLLNVLCIYLTRVSINAAVLNKNI